MKLRYLFLSLLFPITSFAAQLMLDQLATGNIEVVKCPSVSEEYSKMLTKIDTLKASIKKDANCKDVATRLDEMSKLSSDRDSFLGLIEKAKTGVLSETEAKSAGAYVENVTQKVGGLIELISNSSGCFSGDANQQSLTMLSGFVSEASGLLSLVAGPWGAPIAIGGQVISGFITGLDKVMKNRAGYNFSDRNQWSSYVQNLCTYQSFRADITTLLHPQDRINVLRDIQHKLESNLATIQSQCSDCSTIKIMNAHQADSDPQVLAIDSKHSGRLALLSVRTRLAKDWVANEINRISTESNAYWNNVTGKTLLSQADRDMQGFLIDSQAPRFVDFQISQTASNFGDLSQFLMADGATIARQGATVSPPLIDLKDLGLSSGGFWSAPNYAPIYKLITSSDWRAVYKSQGRADDDLEYRLINVRKQAMDKYEAATWAYGTAYVFCDFFRQSDLYSASIQRSCNSTQSKNLMNSLAAMDPATASAWQDETAKIQSGSWADALSIWSDQVQSSLSSPQLQ